MPTTKNKPKRPNTKRRTNKPGVIESIAEYIVKSGEKGVTKKQIVARLRRRFPDRSPESMANTVDVQVPTRISKEKFNVERTEDGRYVKVEK